MNLTQSIAREKQPYQQKHDLRCQTAVPWAGLPNPINMAYAERQVELFGEKSFEHNS
ncbi:MAG: hypothetical protein ABSF51_08840 [Verrucomicrobiota bacterium]